MQLDPQAGPAYQYPANDGGPEPAPFTGDPGFNLQGNPDGSDIGPLYMSPEAERWVQENVIDHGYAIDWVTREILDRNGEVKGTVPTEIPRIV